MKIDKKKFEIACARARMNPQNLKGKDVSSGTLSRVTQGCDVKPKTVGIIAKALNVDVLDIIVPE